MAFKFVRGLDFTGQTIADDCWQACIRFIYEFWGYCINGTSSLTTPGGMPSATPFQTFPTNHFEGTSVLATGNDGVTSASSAQTFGSASATFTSALVGKHIVLWKPGSDSTDDSIYPIRAVPNANTLILESRCGGTPDPVSLKLGFTDRSSINYRIIDLAVVFALTPADGSYLVLQMDGPSVNVGQANSQIQLIKRTTGQQWGFVLSPNGSWTGGSFTSATAEFTVSTFGGGAGGIAWMSMFGDKASLFFSANTGFGSATQWWEIPKRLYPQASDPNPMVLYPESAATSFFGTVGFQTSSMRAIGTDNVVRVVRALVRATQGDGQDAIHDTVPGATQLDPASSTNQVNGKALSSEIMTAMLTTGQYFHSRMKLRCFRMTGAYWPKYTRFGDFGEWLHIQNGIMIPWDNALMPIPFLPLSGI